MKKTIIGVTGRKQSGKDTFCINVGGFDATYISFADPVKEITKRIFNINFDNTEDHKEGITLDLDRLGSRASSKLMNEFFQLGYYTTKEFQEFALSMFKGQKTVRQILQIVGTDIGRKLDPEIWLKLGKERIQRASGLIMIPDARFKNERAVLREMGAKLVFINRPSDKIDLHSSENDLDDEYDFIINNNGTYIDFINKCTKVGDQICGGINED